MKIMKMVLFVQFLFKKKKSIVLYLNIKMYIFRIVWKIIIVLKCNIVLFKMVGAGRKKTGPD